MQRSIRPNIITTAFTGARPVGKWTCNCYIFLCYYLPTWVPCLVQSMIRLRLTDSLRALQSIQKKGKEKDIISSTKTGQDTEESNRRGILKFCSETYLPASLAFSTWGCCFPSGDMSLDMHISFPNSRIPSHKPVPRTFPPLDGRNLLLCSLLPCSTMVMETRVVHNCCYMGEDRIAGFDMGSDIEVAGHSGTWHLSVPVSRKLVV